MTNNSRAEPPVQSEAEGLPRMLECADAIPDADFAITVAWPDGSETVELVSQNMEDFLSARLAEAKLAATPPNASAAEVTNTVAQAIIAEIIRQDGEMRDDGGMMLESVNAHYVYLDAWQIARAALAAADAGGRPPVRDVMLVGPVNGRGEQDAAGYYFMLVLTDNDARSDYLISRGAAEVLGAEIAGIDAGGRPGPVAGEVVGYVFELANAFHEPDETYTNWGPPQFSFTKPCVPEGAIRNLRPLYASRQTPKPDAASSEEADAGGWLPIESAPWNEPILMGGYVKGVWKQTVFEIEREHWREDFEYLEDEPSHYMHLPAPPQQPKQDGSAS